MNPTGETPEAKGPYVRPLNDLNTATAADKQKVFDLLSALNDLCVRMTVDGEEDAEASSDTTAFIKELRDRANVHLFVNAGA